MHVGWLLESDTCLEKKHLEACLSCRWARLSVHGTPLPLERTPTNDDYSELGIWQKWTGWVHPFHGKQLTANDKVGVFKRKIRILENLHQPLWVWQFLRTWRFAICVMMLAYVIFQYDEIKCDIWKSCMWTNVSSMMNIWCFTKSDLSQRSIHSAKQSNEF